MAARIEIDSHVYVITMIMVYWDDVTGSVTGNVDSVWQGVHNERVKMS